MKRFAFAVLCLLSFYFAEAQGNWTMKFGNVRVVRQRESSGDRPYFYSIFFRTPLIGGNLVVEPLGFEPNDWVSKREYNMGRLGAGRDHMFTGQSLPLPFWMGEKTWSRVTLGVSRNADSLVLPEIMGAIILSFDNNNTPPHVMKNLLQRASFLVREYITEFKRNVTVNLRTREVNFTLDSANKKTLKLVGNMLSTEFLLEMVTQITLGSTFNPDKPTGIRALLFTNMTDLGRFDTTLSFVSDDPVIFQGRPLEIGASFRPLRNLSEFLTFKGCGAEYRLGITLNEDPCHSNPSVRSFSVRVKTGDDDLRGGSFFSLVLLGTGDRELGRFDNVNRSAELARNSQFQTGFSLGTAVRVKDIKKVRVVYRSVRTNVFQTGDNWDMEALSIDAVDASGRRLLFATHGMPQARFNENTLTEKTYVVTGCR